MSRYTTTIPAYGSAGNIFQIGATAGRKLRELGHSRDEIEEFRARLTHAESYNAALAIVEEYFPLDRGNDC